MAQKNVIGPNGLLEGSKGNSRTPSVAPNDLQPPAVNNVTLTMMSDEKDLKGKIFGEYSIALTGWVKFKL